MEKQKERREYPRFKCEVPVVILRDKPMTPSSTLMLNYSKGGLYFEVSDPITAGVYIKIKTKGTPIFDPVGPSIFGYRPAEVRWCIEIGEGNTLRHGCGVQYVSDK